MPSETNLFSPNLQRRYRASLRAGHTELPTRWPAGCGGAGNAFLVLLGPSPGGLRRGGKPAKGGGKRPVPSPDQWIAVTDDGSFHDKPVWSPDGNLLYFTSDRDGFRCIWAQRLDPKTKRPIGPALEIYHSHSARRSLLNANIIPLELHVAPGRLLFHLGETTGNIWMVEWKTR